MAMARSMRDLAEQIVTSHNVIVKALGGSGNGYTKDFKGFGGRTSCPRP